MAFATTKNLNHSDVHTNMIKLRIMTIIGKMSYKRHQYASML